MSITARGNQWYTANRKVNEFQRNMLSSDWSLNFITHTHTHAYTRQKSTENTLYYIKVWNPNLKWFLISMSFKTNTRFVGMSSTPLSYWIQMTTENKFRSSCLRSLVPKQFGAHTVHVIRRLAYFILYFHKSCNVSTWFKPHYFKNNIFTLANED